MQGDTDIHHCSIALYTIRSMHDYFKSYKTCKCPPWRDEMRHVVVVVAVCCDIPNASPVYIVATLDNDVYTENIPTMQYDVVSHIKGDDEERNAF